MNWKELNKKAVLLFATGKVKKISERDGLVLFEVDEHNVSITTKKGQTYLECDCFNNSLHPIRNPICYHKLACILYSQREVFK